MVDLTPGFNIYARTSFCLKRPLFGFLRSQGLAASAKVAQPWNSGTPLAPPPRRPPIWVCLFLGGPFLGLVLEGNPKGNRHCWGSPIQPYFDTHLTMAAQSLEIVGALMAGF